MDKPKVSVIVPVCNVENYLEQCVESVIRQKLKEIEIICVNDGSTDRSLEILNKLASKDARMKVIDKPNAGYGNTMNVGMDAAEGDYIGIVESDDFVDTNMFKRLYETAVQHNLDIVKSDHYTFSTRKGKKKLQRHYICPEEYYNKVLNTDKCEEVYNFVMMTWTGLYRTDFIRKYKIRHNETPGASFQDNGFWFQTLTMAERVMFIKEAFYYYRQDNPNSSINNKAKVYCICEEYDFIEQFLRRNPEKFKKHYPSFLVKRFFNYLHSYKRIAQEYKIEFLKRFREELLQLIQRKELPVDELDPWIVTQIYRIIDNPELYYYEDEMCRLNEEYQKIHEKNMELRNSNEYLKGIKLRKKLTGR